MLARRGFVLLSALIAAFHLANASMLPLVVQKLALNHPGAEAPYVSACILTAQFAAIPAGMAVASRSASKHHRLLLLLACALLPLRGAIFAVTDRPVILVTAQILDGLGAGLLDALIPLLLAEMMQETGRYSAARGVLGFVQGIGGSLSNLASGLMVVAFGYAASFFMLTSVALVACAFAWMMLETD